MILSALIPLTTHTVLRAEDYAISADLSFLKRAEDRGVMLVEVAFCRRATENRD